ncbi:portal protein [Helicobacter ailurogastricus]|uniref:portal protein n=1 Tax=Helicobacter ailurogastricus TaxID=1578720 RepID=UPI00244D8102|nr:portal protein [Helicobacter ailurogastricus]GMB91870.1 phage portal protein [Helicobacter ailurogastricus]
MKDFNQLQRDFKKDQDRASKSIQEFKQAKAYYHGNQLPPDVLHIITERGQTPIVENIYKMIVNKIMGYKIQSIQEVRLTPRQEENRALADLLNDLLKYFSQKRNFDKEMIKRDQNLIMGGLGVIELWPVADFEGNIDIQIKALDPQSFIIDAFSTDANALDARRLHKVMCVPEEQSQEILPGVEVICYESDGERMAVIIETWVKEKEGWDRYLWHQDGGIYLHEPTPFKNKMHPFIVAKFYIDEEGNYYGLFRDIKPMQDYINYAENRMGNMMGSFKAMFEEDSVVNIDEFVETMSLDNAIVKVRPGALKEQKIQFLNNQADIAALSQKAEQKRQLLKILAGLNDESLGMAVNRQSGVAIAQRRESGLMGLQNFLKVSDDMDKLIFELAVSFISHYFTKRQVFRIVDAKVGDRYFSINSSAQNQIKPCKFDLIYKTQLKTESKDEKFSQWNELLKVISPIRPDLVPNLLPLMLKDTDSPLIADIEEVLAQAEQAQAKQVEATAPYQEQLQALELEKLKAQVMELQAKAHKYTQQGELVQSQTTTEQIAQVQQVENPQSTDKAKGSTWQKYPSAQHLEY